MSYFGPIKPDDTLDGIDYIQFDTVLDPDNVIDDLANRVPGRLAWNTFHDRLELGLPDANENYVVLGEQIVEHCINKDNVTINKGQIVYLSGAQGDKLAVKLASNTSDTTSSKTFGIAIENIAPNEMGYIMNRGSVYELSLGSPYVTGDILWLGSTPGSFTRVKPVAPEHLVFVGVVLRANPGNGGVFVSPQNGYELDEIHDVLISNPQTGQTLEYESGLWKNKTEPAVTKQLAALDMSATNIDTLPRFAVNTASVPSSGDLWFAFFTPMQTITVNSLSMSSASPAAATVTTAQMALYSVDGSNNLTLIGNTANDTNLFTSTFTVYNRNLVTPVTLTAGTRYAFAFLVVASTMPSLYVGGFNNNSIMALAPRKAGVLGSQTALQNTVSAPGGAAPAYINGSRIFWGRVST